jgi:hypothetical protein
MLHCRERATPVALLLMPPHAARGEVSAKRTEGS